MNIQCPSCRAKVAVEDVNLDRMLAKCRACQSVFEIGNQVPNARIASATRLDKASIPQPRSIKVEEEGVGLLLTRRWRRGSGWLLVGFAAFWNSILSIFIAVALFEKNGFPGPFPGFIWLFLTPFLLVGIGMLYGALAFLLNRTTIRIGDGRIGVRSSPVPWPGNLSLGTQDLVQLYSRQHLSHTKGDVPMYHYEVWGLWQGGHKAKVVGGMEDQEQAYFIEHAIEKHLGLEHAPVEGEYLG
jgi:predicted Zn finger-like uncharacterized protein